MTRHNQTVWFNKARECDGDTVTDRRQVNEEEYEQGLCGVDGLAPTTGTNALDPMVYLVRKPLDKAIWSVIIEDRESFSYLQPSIEKAVEHASQQKD